MGSPTQAGSDWGGFEDAQPFDTNPPISAFGLQLLTAADGAAAATLILPTQTGHAGEYLTTNGTVTSWAAAAGGGTWGNITGTLSSQTDLQSALDAKLSSVLSGRRLYVDSVNGNDGTAVSGRSDKPYLTLAAAKAAAVSGDVIIVGPGTYNERNLLKNGVNWYFEAGATVAYTGSSAGGIFDDSSTGANGAVTSTISGDGIFSSTGTGASANSVILLSNASSNVIFAGKSLACDNSSTGIAKSVNHLNGSLTVRARSITSAGNGGGTGGAVYWENGQSYIDADYISVEDGTGNSQTAVWSAAPSTPTGQFHVRARLINSASGNSGAVYSSGSNAQRVWIFAEQILSTTTAVWVNGGFVYVIAEKVTGQVLLNGAGGTTTILGTMYLNTQKLAVGSEVTGLPMVSLESKNRVAFIDIAEVDDTGLSTVPVISMTAASSTNANMYLRNASIKRTTAGDGIYASNGTVYLRGIVIENITGGYKDINQSGGGVIYNMGAKYDPANVTGTVTNAMTILGTSTALQKGNGTGGFSDAVAGTDYLAPAAIGSTVQAYDADLTTWAGITPGTGVGTALAINVGSAGAFVTNNAANTFSALNTFTDLKLSSGKIYPSSDSTTAIRVMKADGTTAVGTWDTSTPAFALSLNSNLTIRKSIADSNYNAIFMIGTPSSTNHTLISNASEVDLNTPTGGTMYFTRGGTTQGFFDASGNFTFSNNLTVSTASAASTPAEILTGTWFTGGTGTTTFPHLLLQATGTTASTAWSTAGTAIGVNAVTGFTGNLIDLQLAGTSRFKVSASAGDATFSASVTATNGQFSGLLRAGASSSIQFGSASRSHIKSSANGLLELLDQAETSFTGLNFGGATNSFSRIGFDVVNGFTLQSAAGTATWNDGSTAGSGTVANRYLFGIAAPTLTATNATVTDTVASTVYIGGAPTASTNTTIGTAYALNVAAGVVKFGGGTVILPAYTVATLPSTAATGMVVGATAYVTDALAPAFLATVVGGGAITTTVFYNGANWVAQ